MKFFLTLIFSLLLVSCSQNRPTGKTAAEVLFKEAQVFVKDGRYILATEKLNILKTQHPYSFYATHAELLQADILFLQENFLEAAAAYILFRDFHPKHKRMSYVIWKIAESYDKQIPDTHDRDLSPAVEAMKYYREILAKYPRSEYVQAARENIDKAQKMIEMKERYIADFYFKTEVYDAARFRYLLMIKQFNKPDILEHSMDRVVETSLLLEEYEKCIDYAQKFLPLIQTESRKKNLSNAKEECSQKIKA